MNPYQSSSIPAYRHGVAEGKAKFEQLFRRQCYLLAGGYLLQAAIYGFVVFVACIIMGDIRTRVWGLDFLQQKILFAVTYATLGVPSLFCALLACLRKTWAVRSGLALGFLAMCINLAALTMFSGGVVSMLFFGLIACLPALTIWQTYRVLRTAEQLRDYRVWQGIN